MSTKSKHSAIVSICFEHADCLSRIPPCLSKSGFKQTLKSPPRIKLQPTYASNFVPNSSKKSFCD